MSDKTIVLLISQKNYEHLNQAPVEIRRESHFRPSKSPTGIRALTRVIPQVADDVFLMRLALMYMTVFIMVVDTQDMRAVRKYAFPVIRRSFQHLSHLCSCR